MGSTWGIRGPRGPGGVGENPTRFGGSPQGIPPPPEGTPRGPRGGTPSPPPNPPFAIAFFTPPGRFQTPSLTPCPGGARDTPPRGASGGDATIARTHGEANASEILSGRRGVVKKSFPSPPGEPAKGTPTRGAPAPQDRREGRPRPQRARPKIPPQEHPRPACSRPQDLLRRAPPGPSRPVSPGGTSAW